MEEKEEDGRSFYMYKHGSMAGWQQLLTGRMAAVADYSTVGAILVEQTMGPQVLFFCSSSHLPAPTTCRVSLHRLVSFFRIKSLDVLFYPLSI